MANKPEGNITKKAAGGMLGAACGDALGWPNERIEAGLPQTKTGPRGRLRNSENGRVGREADTTLTRRQSMLELTVMIPS
jgi:ADP-ribosylglycohydrolase